MQELNNIIHDLRNPLNNIVINAELARILVEQGGDKQRILASIEQIIQQCASCANGMDDLKKILLSKFPDEMGRS